MEDRPWSVPLEVRITTHYTTTRVDVDNVVKPILDGMKGVLYEDDCEIFSLVSRRVVLLPAATAESLGTLLADVFPAPEELVHIVLIWQRSEEQV